MFRPLSMIFAASAALMVASAAHAGTHWSVGINLAVPGVVVTNGGYYVSEPAAPVYYAPAPVVRYAPVPVYAAPPAYVTPQVVYSSEQAIYEVPYRAESYRAWDGDRYSHLERHRRFERARWEHTRRGREEERRGRGEHWRDDGDAGRRHHD
jgi:hypothetical protein